MSLAIQHGFSKVVLLFFFLLLCEILSPVCPPKIFFKNLHIDTQYFIQQKHRLRGQVSGNYQRLAYIIKIIKAFILSAFLFSLISDIYRL